MANTTDTPPETLKAATEHDILPIHRMTLIGTFDKAGGTTALIRTAAGEMKMLSTGDQLGAATVTAIDMGFVQLSAGSHSARLTLPEEAEAEG